MSEGHGGLAGSSATISKPTATTRQRQHNCCFGAADAVCVYASRTGDHSCYEKAIEAVDEGFRRLGQPGQQEPLDAILAGAYVTKSNCLDHIGRANESLAVYDEAVSRFPEDTTLLTARGLRRQKLGRSDAIDDFRRAVERGTSAAWAYVELARDELRQGRSELAFDLCKRALRSRNTTRPFRRRSSKLTAIAMVRRHESTDAIRAAFQRAGELDPLNEEIRMNRDRFECFTAHPDIGEPEWQMPSKPPRGAIDDVYA